MATLDDNAPLTVVPASSAPSSVEDRITLAGSRARAARRAAASFASERLLPGDAAASFPAPALAASGPALSFMFCLSAPDMSLKDYVLYAPELEVTVDAANLQVVGCRAWRTPVNPAAEKCLTPWQPALARQLPTADRDSLEHELFLLCDQIAPLYWSRAALSEADRAAAARYDRLFRFLAPAALFPYYDRLSPSFFAWLASESALRDRGQAKSSLQPRPGLAAPPRLLPDPWAAPVVHAWDPAADPFSTSH